MQPVLDFLFKAVVILGMMSLLVAAHEWGHYLFARLCKMGVEEFAVGMFGKRPLTLFRRSYLMPLPEGVTVESGDRIDVSTGGAGLEGGGEPRYATVERVADGRLMARETTEFNLRPWPIGGFVRIKGMHAQEDGSETRIPGGFYSRPPWQRIIVLLAGPAFSVLAGLLVLFAVYGLSETRQATDKPILGAVGKGSPAEKAGLRPGDRIVSVAGEPTPTFFSMVQVVRDLQAKPTPVVLQRDGRRVETVVTPALTKKPIPVLDARMEPTAETRVQAQIGVAPQTVVRRMSPSEAWATALRRPGQIFAGTLAVFRKPAEAKDNVGGTIEIVDQASKALDTNIQSFITFAGFFSIAVGVFNLLPIFPLDGGQIVVAAVEMLRGGRRLSLATQNAIALVGFSVLILIIVAVNANDILKRLVGA